MIISKLIEQLKEAKKKHGDIEVTMQASLLQDGYCSTEGGSDVFESTIETLDHGNCWLAKYHKDEKGFERIRLYWQM